MKLAVNYSTQAAVLLRNKTIQLDYFKCPDWKDLIAEAQVHLPVAVHFNLIAGNGRLKRTDWDLIKRIKEQTNTPYVSLHLESTTKDFPGYDPENLSRKQEHKVMDTIRKDIHKALEVFTPSQVILENVPYRGRLGRVLRSVVEPENISRLIHDTGCGLLLDISHARIAAHFLDLRLDDYLNQLPIQHIKELHFTGLHPYNGWLQDHLEALPGDWPILDSVLEQFRTGKWAKPWLIAYEVGGVGEKFSWRTDGQALARDIPRLFQLVTNI